MTPKQGKDPEKLNDCMYFIAEQAIVRYLPGNIYDVLVLTIN